MQQNKYYFIILRPLPNFSIYNTEKNYLLGLQTEI